MEIQETKKQKRSMFKERIKHIFSYTQTLWKSHPYTCVTVIVGTLFAFIWSILDGILDSTFFVKANYSDIDKVFSHLVFWMVMLVFAVYLTDTLIKNNKSILKIIITASSSVITFFFSGLVTGMVWGESLIDDVKDSIGIDRIAMYVLGYFAVLFLLDLFFSFREIKDGFSFADYLMGVLSEGFLIGVVYGVVNIGLAILTLVFTELLFGSFDDIFLPLFALVSGLYLGGASISAVARSTKDVPKFIKVLFKYVLYSMCLAAYLIVYLYIIKIVFFSKFPSNSVFAILTALFCCSLPLAYLNCDKTEGFFGKSAKILPYVFAPLTILQVYTVAVRIHQYGLTPSRYLGSLFIVFELVYIMWYAVKKDTLHYVPVVLAIAAFIFCAVPGIDVLSMPKLTQVRALDKLLDKDGSDLSDDERDRLHAAYDYLRKMDGGNKFLKSRYSTSQIEYMSSVGDNDDYDYLNEKRVTFSTKAVDIDISGYDHFARIKSSQFRSEDNGGINIKKLPVDKIGSKPYSNVVEQMDIKFDARELFEFLISDEYDENEEDYLQSVFTYDVEGYRIMITEATFTYNDLSEKVVDVDIYGYILW
ncbi:MAG: DUF4153 domain-containing protein [Lachnospiraceae bacterium]|nr:DUF4153 domain-containing protein [Lachnospiraceae bacterium]